MIEFRQVSKSFHKKKQTIDAFEGRIIYGQSQ